MVRRSPHIDDAEGIRMVFQRACTAGAQVHLEHGAHKGDFRLLVEEADRLVVQVPDVVRGQWGLKAGQNLTLRVTDRGRPFEAIVHLEGHGRFEGEEACHVTVPRQLRGLDSHRLTDFCPDKPVPCAFTTLANDVVKGLGLAFGDEGMEVGHPDGGSLAARLRIGTTSTVELSPDAERKWVLPATVTYFGDGLAGLKWKPEADPEALKAYRSWILEAERAQLARDRAGFDPRGSAAPKVTHGAEDATRSLTRPRIQVDRDPMVLVLVEGDTFPKRLAEGLGRRFGIASLDHLRGPIHPLLAELGAGLEDWGRIKLILIHHHVRSGTALEACRQLVSQEDCPLPVLVVGTEEDAGVKRNRAIAAGAVDYLVVEPYNVLKVMMAMEQTLKMFG